MSYARRRFKENGWRDSHSVRHVGVGVNDSTRSAERRDQQAVLARGLDKTRDLHLRGVGPKSRRVVRMDSETRKVQRREQGTPVRRTSIVASSMIPSKLFDLANLTASRMLVHRRSSSTRFAGTSRPAGPSCRPPPAFPDRDNPQYDAKKTEKLGCFQLSAVQTIGLKDESTIRRCDGADSPLLPPLLGVDCIERYTVESTQSTKSLTSIMRANASRRASDRVG